MDDFEGPDVGELGGDELPERRLLRLQPLAELGMALHDVRPVVLEAVQRLLHLQVWSKIRNTNETSRSLKLYNHWLNLVESSYYCSHI